MRSGGRKDLPLSLACERRPLAGDRAIPGERVGDRLLERAETEARRDRAADVCARHARVVRAGKPERQLAPGLHGASTCPPAAIRRGQYVKRSVGSNGPTIRPARTRALRSPYSSSTTRSQAALSAP